MTSRDFCYWLQGFFEIEDARQQPTQMTPVEVEGLSVMQCVAIKRHLAMVFLHEIDKTHGDAKEQAALTQLHGSPLAAQNPSGINSGKIMRC